MVGKNLRVTAVHLSKMSTLTHSKLEYLLVTIPTVPAIMRNGLNENKCKPLLTVLPIQT